MKNVALLVLATTIAFSALATGCASEPEGLPGPFSTEPLYADPWGGRAYSTFSPVPYTPPAMPRYTYKPYAPPPPPVPTYTPRPYLPQDAHVPPAPAAPSEPLVYEVAGEVSAAANITYSSGGSNTSQENDVSLPWTFEIAPEDNVGFIYVSAQSASGEGGSITCRISRGDTVITENVSNGPYAIVTCTP